jgi:hypothetical protein
VSSDVRKWTLFDNKNWTLVCDLTAPRLGAGWLVQVVHRRDPRAGDATLASLVERRVGGACAPTWASPGTGGSGRSPISVSPKATRRLDGDQFVEIKINNRLQRLTGGTIAQRLGQCLEPVGIFRLQGKQFGGGGAPALRSGAPPLRVNRARRCRGRLALTIAGLALGAGQGTLTLRRAAPVFRHVTVLPGDHAVTATTPGTGAEIAGALSRPERRFSRSR